MSTAGVGGRGRGGRRAGRQSGSSNQRGIERAEEAPRADTWGNRGADSRIKVMREWQRDGAAMKRSYQTSRKMKGMEAEW